MAKLDFPVATTDGQVWTGTNGVIYTYVGTPPNGYWQGITGDYAQGSNANIHVGDTPPLDPEPGNLWWDSSNDSGRLYMFYEDVDSSQWVEASPSGTGEDGEDSEPTLWDKNGNDLEPKVVTDNVVIGGDKITLNATDGSANFAGQVVAQVNNASGDDAALKAVQTNANGYALWIGSGPTAANRTASVLPDGTITTVGTANFVGGNGRDTDNSVGINSDARINIRQDISLNDVWNVYSGDRDTVTSRIKADGSAKFAGSVTVSPNSDSSVDSPTSGAGGVGFVATGSSSSNQAGRLRWFGNSTSENTIFSVNVGSSAVGIGTRTTSGMKIWSGVDGNKWKLDANGSATFAGNVTADNVTFNLEADDDTKYTSTTDTDGNETLVYNGDVLDVKELLLTLRTAASRIESLETAKASLEARLTALEGAY